MTSSLSSSALLQIYVEIRTSYLLSFVFKPQGVNLTDPAEVQSFASGLLSNSTSSSLLAKSTAPLFGINASSVRQVVVNWTSVDSLSFPNGTLIYVVRINMTVVAGSIPLVSLPAPLQAALDAKKTSIALSRRRLQSISESRPLSLHLDSAFLQYLAHKRTLHSLGLMFDSLHALSSSEDQLSRRSLTASQPCLGTYNLTVPNASFSDVLSASPPTPSCSSSFVSVDLVTQAYLLGAFADTAASLVNLQVLSQSMQDIVSSQSPPC